MTRLFCFGLGYSAEHYIAEFGARFARIAGTVRSAEKAERINREGLGGRAVEALVFDGTASSHEVEAALAQSDALLVSIAPGPDGDCVLRHFSDAIDDSPIASIVYLSTVGVYGDHKGAWIDEHAATDPLSARSRERLLAEQGWQALAQRAKKPLAILRLAGIYGPGQNALENVRRGTAKRIVKQGQVFNRIHVADIAQAIEGAFLRRIHGLFNVSDDEPAPGEEVVAYAAALLGVEPPPVVPYDVAEPSMSPMAKSFYGEVKRVRNDRMKRELGVTLRHPTYREGIGALYAQLDQKSLP